LSTALGKISALPESKNISITATVTVSGAGVTGQSPQRGE